MFTTRATVPLGLMVGLVIIAYRLDPRDLKDILLRAIDSAWLCALGWIMFALSIVFSVAAFRWRERIYQRELDRIQEVKNNVVKGQLEIKFPKLPLTR
jgi:RNAse (barnase) inhibitor barstar